MAIGNGAKISRLASEGARWLRSPSICTEGVPVEAAEEAAKSGSKHENGFRPEDLNASQ
jgi:hypothetical protein